MVSKRTLFLYILDQVLSILAMDVALFWSAGRLDWPAAWAATAIWVAFFAFTDLLLLRYNPGLIAERLSPPKGAKRWDKAIMSTFRLLTLARYILAGLDQRYGWSVGFPPSAQVTGILACILGYTMLGWAMITNRYFSQIVRIQDERGHAVATRGPYRFVRHPAYLGMIAFELGMPSLLASWPSFLVSSVCAILLLLRTALEDRTLQVELPGYAEYSRQVRYRLLPGIW